MSSDDVSLQQRPAEGTITDEGVARLREMYGVKLRPEGPYLRDATPDKPQRVRPGQPKA